MKDPSSFDRCLSFINAQFRPGSPQREEAPRLAVTISRQAGCGAWEIARKLAERLDRAWPDPERPWTVFDRELVEKVLEDHHLPARLAEYMPEDRVPYVRDALEELLGLHPPSWELVRKTADTILRLAAMGRVILIGRAAHVITRPLPHMLHLRLIGSLQKRIERLCRQRGWDEKTARAYVERTDRARERYVREHFGADPTDPLDYDLVLNTDRFTTDQAAEVFAAAAWQKLGAERRPAAASTIPVTGGER
ncbi:MAG: cytidylate kinase-like family protein [Verrucomicrobia bacterium]|nr:MAG: cytidylate kinase-like family protein [Verrucomicrobiota bacterium]